MYKTSLWIGGELTEKMDMGELLDKDAPYHLPSNLLLG